VIDGVLAALHIPHQTMSVAKWKRLAELPAEKGLVLAAARRRWPEAPLGPGEASRPRGGVIPGLAGDAAARWSLIREQVELAASAGR